MSVELKTFSSPFIEWLAYLKNTKISQCQATNNKLHMRFDEKRRIKATICYLHVVMYAVKNKFLS